MATIRDVAKQAGVSIASVSAVFNDSGRVGAETRGRVWAAAAAVGYSPNAVARSLRLGRSNLIGMVVVDVTNPFTGQLVRVVERAANAQGFSVIVCNVDGDEERVPAIIEQLRGQHVAGILLTPVGPGAALINQIEARPMPPIVTLDHRLPGLARDYVGFDNRAAIGMLVAYLARLGHERIGLITGRIGRWTADERYEGFLAAMAAARLPVDPALVARSGYEGESAYEVAGSMLTQRSRPTAIVAANNVTALGALQSCLDHGFRCPDDISIVGVDDVPWSGLVRPKVSIVSQPVEEMAGVASRWLLERIEPTGTPPPPREHIAQPLFRPGDSCRDIRAGVRTAA